MDAIREYILRVTASAVLCACVLQLPGKSGSDLSLRKMILGIFMALSVCAPLGELRIGSLKELTPDFRQEAESAAMAGQTMARQEISSVITKRTQAYILDKAQGLGVNLTVEVTLSEDSVPVPKGVVIRGSISPYNKQVLSELISKDLGISEEAQTWIG